MQNLKNKMAIAGIRTVRQRIDDYTNKHYYIAQDWIFLIICLALVIAVIIL